MKRRSFLGFLLGAPIAARAIADESVARPPQEVGVVDPQVGRPSLAASRGGMLYYGSFDDRYGEDGDFAVSSDWMVRQKINGAWMPLCSAVGPA